MESPLEQFVIKPIIPIHIGGVDISFSQSALWMVIAVFVATALMTLCMHHKTIVPGRLQNIPEMLYEVIFSMVNENLGSESKKYFPFIFSVFMTILMGNLLGLIPYAFTFTSHIIVTGAMALMVLTVITGIGIARNGLHFFSLFLPKGIPLALAPLLITIEVVSYLSRPISLSVRLFANMVAGHTMMKVFASFSVMTGVMLGVLPMVVNVAIYGLEVMIAIIQAYVFTILTCLYLKEAIELH